MRRAATTSARRGSQAHVNGTTRSSASTLSRCSRAPLAIVCGATREPTARPPKTIAVDDRLSRPAAPHVQARECRRSSATAAGAACSTRIRRETMAAPNSRDHDAGQEEDLDGGRELRRRGPEPPDEPRGEEAVWRPWFAASAAQARACSRESAERLQPEAVSKEHLERGPTCHGDEDTARRRYPPSHLRSAPSCAPPRTSAPPRRASATAMANRPTVDIKMLRRSTSAQLRAGHPGHRLAQPRSCPARLQPTALRCGSGSAGRSDASASPLVAGSEGRAAIAASFQRHARPPGAGSGRGRRRACPPADSSILEIARREQVGPLAMGEGHPRTRIPEGFEERAHGGARVQLAVCATFPFIGRPHGPRACTSPIPSRPPGPELVLDLVGDDPRRGREEGEDGARPCGADLPVHTIAGWPAGRCT